MIALIKQILPQIKNFSDSLTQQEIFIDQPWVLLDENSSQKYIFRRGGELLISINNNVERARWEYMYTAKCLLLKYQRKELLLEHVFAEKAIMILKTNSSHQEFMILVNTNYIKDGDVYNYLRSLVVSKLKLREIHTKDIGDVYVSTGKNVNYYDVDFKLLTAKFKEAESHYVREVADGKLIKGYFEYNVRTSTGNLTILANKANKLFDTGNIVLLDSKKAKDGKLYINQVLKGKHLSYLEIRKGKIQFALYQSDLTVKKIIIANTVLNFLIPIILIIYLLFIKTNYAINSDVSESSNYRLKTFEDVCDTYSIGTMVYIFIWNTFFWILGCTRIIKLGDILLLSFLVYFLVCACLGLFHETHFGM